jgi:protein phosphatase 2C family protein 2/3
MSGHKGEKVYSLSRDHRPSDEREYKRIIEAGGKIYQTEANLNSENIIGPLRVIPGKLSVSRTIGDIECKDIKAGGNPNVIISMPEIKYFDISSTNEFILIGCDGIFEKVNNKEIIANIWKTFNSEINAKDLHHLCGFAVENLIDNLIHLKAADNLTSILILFKDVNKLNDRVISNTQQVIKIPKNILDNNNANVDQKQILSKIIKSTQLRQNMGTNSNEKFIPLNPKFK